MYPVPSEWPHIKMGAEGCLFLTHSYRDMESCTHPSSDGLPDESAKPAMRKNMQVGDFFNIYNRTIPKRASHTDCQTVYVHMYTLENSWQNYAK